MKKFYISKFYFIGALCVNLMNLWSYLIHPERLEPHGLLFILMWLFLECVIAWVTFFVPVWAYDDKGFARYWRIGGRKFYEWKDIVSISWDENPWLFTPVFFENPRYFDININSSAGSILRFSKVVYTRNFWKTISAVIRYSRINNPGVDIDPRILDKLEML